MRYGLAAVLLFALTQFSPVLAEGGTVVEITPDTITILQGGIKKLTFHMSNELLTNTFAGEMGVGYTAPFIDVKKGCEVDLTGYLENGRLVCRSIKLQH